MPFHTVSSIKLSIAGRGRHQCNQGTVPCSQSQGEQGVWCFHFIAASTASMMVAWYFLSPDAKGAYNMCYIIPMLLGLACLTSGLSLMLLSQNILNLQEDLVVDVQLVASKWLSLLCSILPVLTLLSSLVLSGYVYRYIGLIILGLVMTPLALL